jgi:hypothetical protein
MKKVNWYRLMFGLGLVILPAFLSWFYMWPMKPYGLITDILRMLMVWLMGYLIYYGISDIICSFPKKNVNVGPK